MEKVDTLRLAFCLMHSSLFISEITSRILNVTFLCLLNFRKVVVYLIKGALSLLIGIAKQIIRNEWQQAWSVVPCLGRNLTREKEKD
jgi:hypothetical protein